MFLPSRCHQVLQKLFPSANTVMESCLLGRAGDCCIMIVQNWSEVNPYRSQFDASSPEDDKIVYQLEEDEQQLGINHFESNMRNVLIYDIRTIEQMLLKGNYCNCILRIRTLLNLARLLSFFKML